MITQEQYYKYFDIISKLRIELLRTQVLLDLTKKLRDSVISYTFIYEQILIKLIVQNNIMKTQRKYDLGGY